MKNPITANMNRRAHLAAHAECLLAAVDPVEPVTLDYRLTLAAALRNEIVDARAAADKAGALEKLAAPEAWATLDGDAQYEAVRRIVFWLKRHDGAIYRERIGAFLAPVLDWTHNPDDLRAVAHETYCYVMRYLADERYAARTLGGILFKAAYTASKRIKAAEIRNGSALKTRRIKGDDGDDDRIEEYIIDHAAPTAEPIAPGPEAALIFRDEIDRAARDEIDRAIIAGLAKGYNSREIGKALGKSHTAINKRRAALVERYNAEKSKAAAAADLDASAARANRRKFAGIE